MADKSIFWSGSDTLLLYSDNYSGNVGTTEVYEFFLADVFDKTMYYAFQNIVSFTFFGYADAVGVECSGIIMACSASGVEVLSCIKFEGTSLNLHIDPKDSTSPYIVPFREPNGNTGWQEIFARAPVIRIKFDSISGGNLTDIAVEWVYEGVPITSK